jgi:hypothetical protein
VLVTLAACTDDDGGHAASSTTTASSITTTTLGGTDVTVGMATGVVQPDGSLGNGRHAAFITAIDLDAGTVTVDVIQFLYGEAATRAAAEAGTESPPPNDYIIRNENTRLRTLSVRQGAPVTLSNLLGPETGFGSKDYPSTLEKLASFRDEPNFTHTPFWLDLQDGVVTAIQEQYVP